MSTNGTSNWPRQARLSEIAASITMSPWGQALNQNDASRQSPPSTVSRTSSPPVCRLIVTLSRLAGTLRPDFDNAGSGDVAVECQRFEQAQLPHHREAGRIHKRVDPLVVPAQPGPRLALGLLVDTMHRQARLALDQ